MKVNTLLWLAERLCWLWREWWGRPRGITHGEPTWGSEMPPNEQATFRRMTEKDIQALVKIENRSFRRIDPDFDVKALHPDAWSAEDIKSVVFGEEHTRGWVIEEGDGNIVGYYIYEVEAEAYRLRRLLIHPQYRNANFGRTVLWNIYQKMAHSNSRKTIIGFVSERDIKTCQWMAHMGFHGRVVRNGWNDDTDAIEFTFTTTEHIDRETGERCEPQQEEGAS